MNYYDEFVELCLLQCLNRDYLDKRKLRQHNKSVDKLAKLSEKMIVSECTDILDSLLLNNDDRVKENAAFLCLKKNVLIEKALNVLKELVNSSQDPALRFGAYRMLDLYEKKDEMIFKYHQNNIADTSPSSDKK